MAEGSSFSEVLSPQGVLAAPLSSVGGKAATLARMIQKGIQGPDFFCVSSAAFVRHLSDNEIKQFARLMRKLRDQLHPEAATITD
jgi:phosphoenolpyruvate synthase/pyruvate phosphate dikinase